MTPKDRCINMFADKVAKLWDVWEEVGFSQNERDAQLHQMLDEWHRVGEEKVSDEMAVRDTFKSSIQENKDKIVEWAKRLNETPPDLVKDEDGQDVARLALTEQLLYYENLGEQIEKKHAAQSRRIQELRDELATLCEELEAEFGVEWRDITSDLSETRLAAYEAHVETIRQAKTKRIEEVVSFLLKCKDLMAEMSISPASPLDNQIMGSLTRENTLASMRASGSCVGITATALSSLMQRATELSDLRKERVDELIQIGDKLAALWSLLQVEEEETKAFEASLTSGLTQENIDRGRAEVAKLEKLKIEKIKDIIVQKRNDIQRLWEDTSTPEAMRSQFTPMLVDESGFTDELLEQHEKEIEILTARFETMQPAIKFISKFHDAHAARHELEEIQKDSKRFSRRGSANTLKREEQMAKQIKAIPKLIESARKTIGEWEATQKLDFMYKGEKALDGILEREEQWKRRKEQQAADRKKEKEEAAATSSRGPPPSMALHRSATPKSARRPSKLAANQENSQSN